MAGEITSAESNAPAAQEIGQTGVVIPWEEIALNPEGLKAAFQEGVRELVAAWNYGAETDAHKARGKSDGSYEVTRLRWRQDRAHERAMTTGRTLDMVASHPTHGWIALMTDQSRFELGLMPDGTPKNLNE
jgi:hypothetical protein